LTDGVVEVSAEAWCVCCEMARDVAAGNVDADLAVLTAFTVGRRGWRLTLCAAHSRLVETLEQAHKAREELAAGPSGV
jgi:hypothetical protein